MLKIILIVLAVLFVLGYFFVQWANRPENVAATLKRYAEEKEEAKIDSIKQIKEKREAEEKAKLDAQKEYETQQKSEADLQLVIDENFKNQKFAYLVPVEMGDAKFDGEGLIFREAIVTPKQNRTELLAISKEIYENFVVEMEYEVSGPISVGIAFNIQERPNQGWDFDEACNSYSASQVTIDRDREIKNFLSLKETFGTNPYLKQKTRFEKKGKTLKITINGKEIVQKKIEKYSRDQGNVGIIVHYHNSSEWNTSVTSTIKNFKIWKW